MIGMKAMIYVMSMIYVIIFCVTAHVLKDVCAYSFWLKVRSCIDVLSFFGTKLHICKHCCHGKRTFTGCAADNEENKDKVGR